MLESVHCSVFCSLHVQTIFSSPAVFIDRKRKHGSTDKNTESESIPHFYLIIFDLVQMLMSAMRKADTERKELCIAGVEYVLECAAHLCDYSVTNNCLVVCTCEITEV